MNTTALNKSAAEQTELAPDNQEEKMFLKAIQDQEKREEVIAILKRAGLIPG